MAAETKLNIAAGTTGTQQAAAELQKVADAQGQVGAKVDATAKLMEATKPAVEALAEAQAKLAALKAERATALEDGKSVVEVYALNDAIGEQERKVEALAGEMAGLNVKSQDFVGLLNQIDPRLGAVASSLSRASRLAAEFGISLSTVGLVVGGIYAVSKAVAFATEQLEKATEATKKFEEANASFLKQQRDVQQSIETISDKRREGGLTAQQARGARTTAQGIKDQFGADLDAGAVDEAVGLLSGTGLSRDDMAEAAFLMHSGFLELDPKALPESRSRAVRRAQSRRAGEIGGFKKRVAGQRAEDAQETLKQAAGGGGPELEEQVRAALGPGTADEDIQEAIRLVKAFPTLGSLGDLDEFERGGRRVAVQSDLRTAFDFKQLRTAQQVHLYITNNLQNSRHYSPSARERKEASRNGDNMVRQFERW